MCPGLQSLQSLTLMATAAYDRSMLMKRLLFARAITTAGLQQRWMTHSIQVRTIRADLEASVIVRRLYTSRMATEACIHINGITEVKQPEQRVCEECVKTGDRWVHLRICQHCGATRCCDSSPNKHASKHARASGHPVIASAERGERWLYCYPDDAFAEY